MIDIGYDVFKKLLCQIKDFTREQSSSLVSIPIWGKIGNQTWNPVHKKVKINVCHCIMDQLKVPFHGHIRHDWVANNMFSRLTGNITPTQREKIIS